MSDIIKNGKIKREKLLSGFPKIIRVDNGKPFLKSRISQEIQTKEKSRLRTNRDGSNQSH